MNCFKTDIIRNVSNVYFLSNIHATSLLKEQFPYFVLFRSFYFHPVYTELDIALRYKFWHI